MLGYCATGRLVMDSAPAIIKMIAMTQAKTGRLIKKFAMADFCLLARNRISVRIECDDLDLGSGRNLLQTFDNHSVACAHTARHQPVLSNGTFSLQRAEFDL